MKSPIQTLTNPLKYTDPTGYQTAPAPGANSWLGGGGGMGESNGFSWSGFSHYAKNVFTDPSYFYYDAEGNYHHGFYFGGDEIVSYDEVFDNYVSKRGKDVTYLVKQTGTSFTAKGIDIPFIYKDSWSSNGFGIGVLNVGWLSVVDNAASSQGGDWTNRAGNISTVTGGTFKALENTVVTGDRWLGANGKYYSTSWGGNQWTGSRAGAFEAAGMYRWAGRANVAATVIIGGFSVYNGYQEDGGQFGYNANRAGASATGGLVGGWAGAEAGASIGAAIGVWFGGVGAVPGAIIGGFGGGVVGSFTGSAVGGAAVDYYYDR